MNEKLSQSAASMDFVRMDLQLANKTASPVESLLLLELIKKSVELQTGIMALLTAVS